MIVDAVTIGSKKYDLIEPKRPNEGNFLQLETLTKNKSYSRVIHVIKLDTINPFLRLGRSQDSELRIDDISVSRIHAMIEMRKDGYALRDNGSKFGTLYLLPPGPQTISPTKGLFLQYGRTTLGFSIKPNEKQDMKPINLIDSMLSKTPKISTTLYLFKL